MQGLYFQMMSIIESLMRYIYFGSSFDAFIELYIRVELDATTTLPLELPFSIIQHTYFEWWGFPYGIDILIALFRLRLSSSRIARTTFGLPLLRYTWFLFLFIWLFHLNKATKVLMMTYRENWDIYSTSASPSMPQNALINTCYYHSLIASLGH